MYERLQSNIPQELEWNVGGSKLRFDLRRARATLLPLATYCAVAEFPRAATCLVFGEFDFASGGGSSGYICLDTAEDCVVVVDFERDEVIGALNSGVDAFVATINCFDRAFGEIGAFCLDADTLLEVDAARGEFWEDLRAYLVAK